MTGKAEFVCLTERQKGWIVDRYESGIDRVSEMALDYGVSERTVVRILKERGAKRFYWARWARSHGAG